MHISVYLEEELLSQIDAAIKKKHISRSKAIIEALKQWLNAKPKSGWGEGFFDFEGDPTFPSVEEIRKGMIEQNRDPFAS